MVREVGLADENDGGDGEIPPQYESAALEHILVGKVNDHIRFKEAGLYATMKESMARYYVELTKIV